jgi:hypothetical protein
LTVIGLLIKPVFRETETGNVWIGGTFESEVSGRVAIFNYVRPVAVIIGGIES